MRYDGSNVEPIEHKLIKKKPSKIKRFLRILGPGIITGAADDDPSGIATYSQSGAKYGFGQLWTALYQLPLLIAIQEACARIGAVTGKGLAGIIKENYSKKILAGAVILVVIANTINIGADIGAVTAAAQLVVNLPFAFYAIAITVIVILLEVFLSYKKYARILKWFTLTLLAYPITALLVSQPWGEIFRATIFPHIEFTFAFFFLVTGVFGTTISPYMFFWQTSGEVEEEVKDKMLSQDTPNKPRLTKRFLKNMRIDTTIGMFAAEIAQWFIIITTATVLFKNGITNIGTAADAAKALEPLVHSFPNAGQLARDIFAIGVFGLGFLGIPVLAGSAAYAMSEAFGWKEGLYRKFSKAKQFYAIIILSTIVGFIINFIGINPMKALVFAAVINGVVAVPLIFLIAKINSSEKILGEHKGGKISRAVVWITFIVMALSALSLFYTIFFH